MNRKALGKGLGALLGEKPNQMFSNSEHESSTSKNGLFNISVTDISPNPEQPRQVFEKSALKELSSSISAKGILQPLLITRRYDERGYYIIAGERRWQAAKMAGLDVVPCMVIDTNPTDRLALALIENIQRKDLNALEEASAYARLKDDFGLTHEEIAAAVGRDRATVTNFMRLLKLPESVQIDVVENRLTMGHARALLGLVNLPDLLLSVREKVIHSKLNVRQTEKLVDQTKNPKPQVQPSLMNVQLKAEADELRKRLGAKVKINKNGNKGKIVIEFFSEDELNRLLDWFKQ